MGLKCSLDITLLYYLLHAYTDKDLGGGGVGERGDMGERVSEGDGGNGERVNLEDLGEIGEDSVKGISAEVWNAIA